MPFVRCLALPFASCLCLSGALCGVVCGDVARHAVARRHAHDVGRHVDDTEEAGRRHTVVGLHDYAELSASDSRYRTITAIPVVIDFQVVIVTIAFVLKVKFVTFDGDLLAFRAPKNVFNLGHVWIVFRVVWRADMVSSRGQDKIRPRLGKDGAQQETGDDQEEHAAAWHGAGSK